MSSDLNIPSYVKDPGYRYTMPRIQTVTQGSGGGVKTKWENIIAVAKALKVPTDYPLKFMAKELGSQTEIKNDVYLISGSQANDKLQQILDKFIEKYVLCPKKTCKLPEISIFIKGGEIRGKCRACGNISKLDDKHKFSTHIKNFPPKYDEMQINTTPVVKDEERKEQAEEKQVKKIDKETKEKIKLSMDKINKVFGYVNELEEQKNHIDKILEEAKFEGDLKFFALIHGMFDKGIYRQMKSRIPIIKHYVSKEENQEEAFFHLIAALADFTTNRYKDLDKYISSILYLLYVDDIVTEELWIRFAIKTNLPAFESRIFTRDLENKFLDAAADFTNWIENGLYEDEEERPITSSKKEEIKPVKKEEINIDDI
jgi:translation initiation factor 2 beta subunit (eIF-2beta)/eIF-5